MAAKPHPYPDDETVQEHLRNAITLVQLILIDEDSLSVRLRADLRSLEQRLAIALHRLVAH